MSTVGAYASAKNGGAATVIPRALSEPSTFRKEGLVEIFLTQSDEADPEVAYSDDGVDWCAIGFDNFFFNLVAQTASARSSYRTFRKYLNSPGTNNFAFAISTGRYVSNADSFGTGDTTYNVNGIYRSKVEPFFKRYVDGELKQFYLKTNVTFAGASVNANASDNGSISPQGFKSYDVGAEQAYTATPDTDKFIVSIDVVENGVSESLTIVDRSAAQTHTFENLEGNNSIEATFGHSVTITTNGSDPVSVTSPVGVQYVPNGGSVEIVFSDTPDTVKVNDVDQDVATDQTTFTVSEIVQNTTVVATRD
jgi:hypothetical protein|tara:strand:- start:327 stop:1250 length:924 start_codon:yes stop_codon:yes gene_type:complete